MFERPVVVLILVTRGFCPIPAQPRSPAYRIGRSHRVDSEVYPNISMRLESFEPAQLIRVAADLKRRFVGKKLHVLMFSGHEAAESWIPRSLENNSTNRLYESKLHGVYLYDAGKGEEYVKLLPFGIASGPQSSTRINLPLKGRLPPCKLEIAGRCLLELRQFYCPIIGDRQVGGSVSLTGKILADGRVSRLEIAHADASPSEDAAALAQWAVTNLSLWRFARAATDDDIRIIYRFDPTRRSELGNGAGVEFHLPTEVAIWP